MTPGAKNAGDPLFHSQMALLALYTRKLLLVVDPKLARNSAIGRTHVSEGAQGHVYDKGRTVPNADMAGRNGCPSSGLGTACTVTNAAPGRSMHNAGLAFDHDIWDPETKRQEGPYVLAAQKRVADIVLKLEPRAEWGIDFVNGNIKDRPHFQMKPGIPNASTAIDSVKAGEEVIFDGSY